MSVGGCFIKTVIKRLAAMKLPSNMGAMVGSGASGATSHLTLSKEASNE